MHPNRKSLHLPRRLFHMASGLLIVIVTHLFLPEKKDFILGLFILLAIDLGIEIFRLHSEWVNCFVHRNCKSLMRLGEEKRMSGIAYYLAGCLLSAILFPREIAFLAILFLAVGDPVAAMAGVLFGKRKFPEDLEVPEKSWEGSLACFSVCFLLSLVLSFYMKRTASMDGIERLEFAALGGFSAMVGELLPLRTDDNLAMPLVAGSLLWLLASMTNLMHGIYF